MTGRRALAGITFAAATALAAGAATAQVPYQIGDGRGDVTVDMGVLESLGPLPTVPEMLRPGTPVGELGYDPRAGSLSALQQSRAGTGRAVAPVPRGSAPALGVDTAPAPDWLRRPDAPRYAPLPETLASPSAPRAGGPAPRLTPPRSAAPTVASTAPAPEPEPKAPPARVAAPAPEPAAPPPRREPAPEPARSVASAPPPPKPAAPAPAVTAEARPSAPAPAVKAPEPPAPPALPTAAAPAPSRDKPAAPEKQPDRQTQVAAATPAPSNPPPAPSSQAVNAEVVSVPFDPNQSALPSSASAGLDAVVAKMRKDGGLRVQLLAYADGDEDNSNKARRLSLSRALAVRAYLIDKQIQSTRMDVRALGNRTQASPKDRVDVVLVGR